MGVRGKCVGAEEGNRTREGWGRSLPLDTVFPPSTDVKVPHEGARLPVVPRQSSDNWQQEKKKNKKQAVHRLTLIVHLLLPPCRSAAKYCGPSRKPKSIQYIRRGACIAHASSSSCSRLIRRRMRRQSISRPRRVIEKTMCSPLDPTSCDGLQTLYILIEKWPSSFSLRRFGPAVHMSQKPTSHHSKALQRCLYPGPRGIAIMRPTVLPVGAQLVDIILASNPSTLSCHTPPYSCSHTPLSV